MGHAEFKEVLGKYLAEHNLPRGTATTCVDVCGGTAGGRFQHLCKNDETSWRTSNAALGDFATLPQTPKSPENKGVHNLFGDARGCL